GSAGAAGRSWGAAARTSPSSGARRILINGSLKISIRSRGVNGAKGPHFNVVKTVSVQSRIRVRTGSESSPRGMLEALEFLAECVHLLFKFLDLCFQFPASKGGLPLTRAARRKASSRRARRGALSGPYRRS